MPSVQITTDELVKAIKQLPLEELDRVASEINSWRDQVQALNSTNESTNGKVLTEAELIQKISAGIPKETQARYHALIAKRDARTLTESEYSELLAVTDVIENLDAERASYLGQLARLRNVSLPTLIHDLGIRPTNV